MRSVIVAALASGCGTSILLSYPTHEPFLRANSEYTVSTRPLEDRTQTTVARIQTGPLRVACETTTPASKSEVTYLDSFGGLGRVWCGFMALSEGAIAAGLAFGGSDTSSRISGAIVGADAVGALAYAIFAHSSTSLRTEIGKSMPETSHSCGDGLVVRAGDQMWPVKPDGSLDGDGSAFAAAAVGGQSISIASAGLQVAWSPDAHDRCALVAQFGLADPSGSCAQPTEVAPAPRIVVPIEIQIRLPHPPR
jgi:hypothetical protein